MSREAVRPFLINKDQDGAYRLTVRETKYNSQGYPLVTSTQVEDIFKTASAAKTHARDHYGAKAGEYATK